MLAAVMLAAGVAQAAVVGEARGHGAGNAALVRDSDDDKAARAADARAWLEVRATLLVADIRRTTDADAEQLSRLKSLLLRAIGLAHMRAQASGSDYPAGWVDMTWGKILASKAWSLCQENALADPQRGALVVMEHARAQRLLKARIQVAVVALASELRLRRPQVEQLEPLIADWIQEREPNRSQLLAADAVAEMLTVSGIRRVLGLEQMMRLMRMRSEKRAIVLEDGAPGDDLRPGKGRYPEDDYALEICALVLYHAWDWDATDVLRGAGEMLARGQRRAKPRAWRQGKRNLTLATVEFGDEPLWQAVLERERREHHVAEPAPPPLYTNVQAAYVAARTEFLVALFDERVLLSSAQREALPKALESHVVYEYRRSWSGKVALDAQPNWGLLRINGWRGSRVRSPLAKKLTATLNPDQLAELGLR